MDSDHDRIRARAYDIWDRDGRHHGRDQDHWLQAEREFGAARGIATGAVVADVARSRVNAKSNGAAKAPAAKAPAAKAPPRKRRGAQQPQSQA